MTMTKSCETRLNAVLAGETLPSRRAEMEARWGKGFVPTVGEPEISVFRTRDGVLDYRVNGGTLPRGSVLLIESDVWGDIHTHGPVPEAVELFRRVLHT